MNPEIEKEIKRLKNFRLIVALFFLLIWCGIMGYFGFNVYRSWEARKLRENFIEFIFPTVFLLGGYLLAVFGAIFLFISRRFSFAIDELNDLNGRFSEIYMRYKNFVKPFNYGIPQYIFSQKGLVIIRLLSKEIIEAKSINRLGISVHRFGRNQYYKIKIEKTDGIFSTLKINHVWFKQVDFLVKNIYLLNENIIVYDRTKY